MRKGNSNLSIEIIENMVVNIENDNRPYAKVNIFGQNFIGLLDSGATLTVIGNKLRSLIEKQIELIKFSKKVQVKTADGIKHQVLGYFLIPMKYNGETKQIATLMVPSVARDLILGFNFWNCFNIKLCINNIPIELNVELVNPILEQNIIIKQNIPISFKKKLLQIVARLPTKTTNFLPTTPLCQYNIDTGDEAPVYVSPYIIPKAREEILFKEIDRLIDAGIIEKSEYSSWNNGVFLNINEKGKARFIMDARKLNKKTTTDKYPLHNMSRIFSRLPRAKFFTKIDLTDAFYQVALTESCRHKTSFAILGKGSYRYKRMFFGHKNAPMCMARLLDAVVGYDLEEVFTYIDDICIATESLEKHLEILGIVVERLRSANLTINVEKSVFCDDKIEYLGHIMNEKGMNMRPEKVQAIINMPIPRSKRNKRKLQGTVNFYRRFIPNASDLLAPISELTKDKYQKDEWNEKADAAFKNIKNILTSAPVLIYPDFNKTFNIHTDASNYAAGSVLTQETEGKEHPVAYFSKKFNNSERNYFAVERECLSLVWALDNFKNYIEGTQFKVFTDASALKWLHTMDHKTGSRLMRWALKVQHYDMLIIHKKGAENHMPDLLSRLIETIDVGLVHQVSDPLYEKMLLETKNKPTEMLDFRIENNHLYKYVENRTELGNFEFSWKLYVPKTLINQVLLENHDKMFHIGSQKTYLQIREHYFWPRMARDIKSYIKKCPTCKSCKAPNSRTKATMGKMKNASEPFELICTDYVTHFPRSKKGNKVLLVVMDWFTKYVRLFPLRDATTKYLCKILSEDIFKVYRVAKEIWTDNGPQFKCKDFSKLLNENGVDHVKTPFYHPQANPTERVNRVIGDAIRASLGDNQTLWDVNLREIEKTINNSYHASIKMTPYFALFGRKMITHGSQWERKKINSPAAPVNTNELNCKIAENIKSAFNTYSNTYNKNTTPRELSIGQSVYYKNFKLSSAADKYSPKLDKKFFPAIVKKKIGDFTYELTNLNGKTVGKFHINDIRV